MHIDVYKRQVGKRQLDRRFRKVQRQDDGSKLHTVQRIVVHAVYIVPENQPLFIAARPGKKRRLFQPETDRRADIRHLFAELLQSGVVEITGPTHLRRHKRDLRNGRVHQAV